MGRKAIIAILGVVVFGLVILFLINSKSQEPFGEEAAVTIADSVLFTSAPVLNPEQALQTIRLPEHFRIEIVASEPLIQDPVAMTFDAMGRIWVIEMQSYMQDLQTNREAEKISRIVILEDLDGDGRMDNSKVFLDSLIMPRAIALAGNGVLYAEPPYLWFVENINDTPGKRYLVDSTYAVGGNPEHQPNGLWRGMDNWYYNAKSKYRYKLQDGEWLKDQTEFRGQWGISMDNYGRLFYNTNSNQLRGDLVPPNSLTRNPDFEQEAGINVEIAQYQDVFPIRPTPGINRGYKEEMLDEEEKLLRFTAACSPLIYRGDQYPAEFQGNAFVCEPAGNLIKRNLLIENGPYIVAKQAYENKEFLASTDERFRPVSLNNGPDGNLYVVDMYRGVIQHETFLTDYLRDQIGSRGLERPIGMGRIYRIVYEGPEQVAREENAGEKNPEEKQQFSTKGLIAYLSHANGWWRDYAQQHLIERNDSAAVPLLLELLEAGQYKNFNQVHALWVLEGMDHFTPEIMEKALKSGHPQVRATAIRIGGLHSKGKYRNQILTLFESASATNEPEVQLQLALSLGSYIEKDPERVIRNLKVILNNYANEPLFLEAIISSLHQHESAFLKELEKENPNHQEMLKRLSTVIQTKREKQVLASKKLSSKGEQQYLTGKPLYERACSGCHGVNGEGLVPIAPPLKQSEWVVGPEQRLVSIVLDGLKGPIQVNGKIYKEPEVQPFMPGLRQNKDISDKDLAALLTYIRNSWGNGAKEVSDSTVSAVRKHTMDRTELYTAEELME